MTYQRTPEHIENLRLARVNSFKVQKHIQIMNANKKGIKLSDEHKHKISESLKGRVQTEETKKLIGDAHRGKVVSLETRQKQSVVRKGKPHPKGSKSHAWRGGLTSTHRMIRQSQESFNWRISIFEQDNYTCQHCFIKGGYLEADHIKPFATHPELRFDIENGQTLCKSCHSIKTSEDMKLMRQTTSIWIKN